MPGVSTDEVIKRFGARAIGLERADPEATTRLERLKKERYDELVTHGGLTAAQARCQVLHEVGLNGPAIGRQLGLNKSTVLRNLRRAAERLGESWEKR